MSMPFEFEEAEEVDAGARLVTTPCVRCGSSCLAAPRQVRAALCGECRPQPTMSGPVPAHYHPGGWSTRGPASPPPAEQPPPPVVLARRVGAMRVPAAVAGLQAIGIELGWASVAAYSRGYAPKKYRGSWVEEELVSVRLGGHGRRAVAVYRTRADQGDWTWRSLWAWGPRLLPVHLNGVGDLIDYLTFSRVVGDEAIAEWGVMLADKRREAKARAAARPKKSAAKEGAR